MIFSNRLSRGFTFLSFAVSAAACSSSSTNAAPIIDSYSAPSQVTADSAGNYELVATFSAHDTDSTISKIDFQATGLADNPIPTDNQARYTNQPVKLTLQGAPKGTFAYTFVITDALGMSASTAQTIQLQ